MKNFRRAVSLLLVLTVLCFSVSFAAFAEGSENEGGLLTVMSYNVSGLPFAGAVQGSEIVPGYPKAELLGALMNQVDADIIGVQEDFNFHDSLAAKMTNFPYKTFSSGPIPLGDGLNIFSKLPIYNISRHTWEKRYGVFKGAADQLTPKGFLYSVVEIAEGVYIDFYVLHADAGGDPQSTAARIDNYRQLTEHINTRPHDRAVIVVGDFNARILSGFETDMLNNLIFPAGLSDSWVELCNNGIYSTEPQFEEYEVFESIDKVMYKNGGGVEFTPVDIEHYKLKNERGGTYTDHHATKVVLSYTVNEIVPMNEELAEPTPHDTGFMAMFKAVLTALKLLISDLGNLF